MGIHQSSIEVAGEEIIIETGRMAKQASGAVTVRSGDSVVLAAVVGAPDSDEPKDFFPLTVDYREKYYATGRIPGGFFKREARPTDKETLTSRLIDRPIRSQFPKNYRNEVSISLQVISADEDHSTDILAMIGASAALVVSDIPFAQPIGAVRVGLIDDEFVINPTNEQMEVSDLDLVLAGTAEAVGMIEAGANEVSEEQMFDAIQAGHEAIKKVVELQNNLQKDAGVEKRPTKEVEIPEDIYNKISETIGTGFEALFNSKVKEEQDAVSSELKEKALEVFDTEAEDWDAAGFQEAFTKFEKKEVRRIILEQNKRPDGRGFEEIRQITCEIGSLPRTHGSALFTRGQTQSLGVTTLGTSDDGLRGDTLFGNTEKSFYLHYNFPSFSVGEARPNRGPGRREIGHGALAERSLEAVLPSAEDFPYTIRVVSEILESNGSSSMASVCAGTLSLMDAGVPIAAPVSGIAMGLVTGEDQSDFRILTDIAGIEDFLGDMDFKAAGTENGLTALQMDLKLSGVSYEILKKAFDDSKKARLAILDKIKACIAEPKSELSEFAPRITQLTIPVKKIGELIGPGGKNIRKLIEETGAKIDIEDDGTVNVAAADQSSADEAISRITAATEEAEIGKIYSGEVKRLAAFGAFIEVLPGQDGLCHVSEIADGFVKNAGDYLREGDVVAAKVIGVDDGGKISLSVKAANPEGIPMLPEDERVVVEAAPPRRGGGRRR